jgi:TRAP-type transport system periplasmic protein
MIPIVIKFGGYQAPVSIHNRAARRFGELLGRKLGSRVAFELIPSVLELGRPSGELVPMVERGELSLCYMSTVRFSEAVPEFRLFELPFVVKDRGAVFEVLDGETGDRLRQRVGATTRCRVLGYWDNGIRHLTNKVRAIRAPADCRGLRIRTQMSPLHGETFRALGFEPVAADIKEFVEQIGTDRFQAQDNPLTNIYVFNVHKHHRYITLTGHFFGASLMVCNAEHYRSWPADVQEAVDEAAREATLLQRREAAQEDVTTLQKFDPRENEVIHLTDRERAAFASAVEPVLEKYREKLDPKVFKLLEA